MPSPTAISSATLLLALAGLPPVPMALVWVLVAGPAVLVAWCDAVRHVRGSELVDALDGQQDARRQ